MQMFSWLLVMIGALGNLVIGLVTYLRNTKSDTNRWFGVFSFFMVLYLVFNQLSITQNDENSTLFWIRAVIIIAPAIVFSFFMLANVFPKRKQLVSKNIFVISLFLTIIVMVLGATPLFFESVVVSPVIKPIQGKFIFLFLFYNLFFVSWSVFILFKKFIKSKGIEKFQLKYLILGAVIMFSLIILSNVVLVILFNISDLVVLVPIYTLVFVGMTSYAIIRFGLFDLRIIATEATTAVLWIVLFAKLFAVQDRTEALLDLIVFISVVVFGILLVRSVRQEVEQRRELEALNKRLEELDKQKNEFLNITSHELRAPMTAVKGYISMVQNGDGGNIPVEAGKLLDEAAKESERMLRLINNTLNVARIEEGRMVYDLKKVNLGEVAKRVFDEFAFDAQNKALEYMFDNKATHNIVIVDEDRIHEVVANLINNAIKYTDRGKVEVRIFNPSSSVVRFEVQDTGPGMSDEDLGKLFNKFYRAESYVGKAIGSGLGLYISKLLIEKFGGRIGVRSKKGKGSLFWFELPLNK